MTNYTKAITDMWPAIANKQWPANIGPVPSVQNVNEAATLAKPGTAVCMALAMYLRPKGASDVEAATAAGLATGSQSPTHRNKRDHCINIGTVKASELERRGGHIVVAITLASKPAAKAPKARTKAKATTKPIDATKPEKPASDAPNVTEVAIEGQG